MDKLLTSNEAALFLDINTQEFEDFIQKHKIPHYKIAGKFIRFSQQELEKYKEQANMPHIRDKIVEYRNLPSQEEIEYLKEKLCFRDKLLEFIKFNDFYIMSFCLIFMLLYYILKY
ncbi:MAG: helix-turn-helix domain-containing protein [Candidatus Saelkia tenebricola]|nr:helix-turn-helix domain-containing protein [Candidatus Saelkia tenebricola]